jgi:protoheme ferro-lyase
VQANDLPHAPADHPKVSFGKVGILLANLGTPDHYSYWPMRRYLNEFLSDRRVIDYSPWIWQPLLQLIILSKRPFTSGANYKQIWNHDLGESPLMTITKAQTAKIAAGATKEPFIFFIAAALFFVVVSALTMPLSRRLEARYVRGQAPVRA